MLFKCKTSNKENRKDPLTHEKAVSLEYMLGELGILDTGPTLTRAPYQRISSPASTISWNGFESDCQSDEEELTLIFPGIDAERVEASNALQDLASTGLGAPTMQGLFDMHKRVRIDETERKKTKRPKLYSVSILPSKLYRTWESDCCIIFGR